jgi:hypothetical protein
MTNAERIDADLEHSDIRFMTFVLLHDAPERTFNRWLDSVFEAGEFEIRQSTWRIILQVEAMVPR